jgi:Zn-dependent protease with chaperone function
MRTYQLSIKDFIYPREVPVRIITLLAAAIILIVITFLQIYIGLFFLLSVAGLFLTLYQMAMSTLGSCVRVSPTQFPEIYNLACIAADRLDMDMPPVYIMLNPAMNAFASGFWGNYFVVIHTAAVNALTEEELLATIGHEFTHIKANHVIITNLTQTGVGLVKLFWWLQLIIKYIFLYLSRCQEYTCDRGGLIASGNIQVVITENTKFAIGKELFDKINIMEFFRQAMELDKKPLGILGEMEATHPLAVNRMWHIVRFYRSDVYRRVASMQGKLDTSTLQGSLLTGDLMMKIVSKGKSGQGRYQQINAAYQGSPQFCPKCGTARREGQKYCRGCGAAYEAVHAAYVDTQPVQADNEKICRNCGERNDTKAGFCTECGQEI